MQPSCMIAWRSVRSFSSTSRELDFVPTPSRSAACVPLSSYIFRICYVVALVFRHQRTSKYRDHQRPTHHRLVLVLAGVIYAYSSYIGIDGDSMFTNNSARNNGGEKGRETCIALDIARMTTTAILVCGGALFLSCWTMRQRNKRRIGRFILLAYTRHTCRQMKLKRTRRNT